MLYRIRFINVRFSFSFIYFEILEKKVTSINEKCMQGKLVDPIPT